MIRRSDRGGVYDAIEKAAKSGNLPDELKPSPVPMKTFKGVRKLTDIMETCVKNGWMWDSRKMEAGESDYIKITFDEGFILLSSFNGKFFGELKAGGKIDSNATTHESQPWFRKLLEAIYAQ